MDYVERKILGIAEDLSAKNEIVDLKNLFENSKKILYYLTDEKISEVIYNLILKNYLFEGTPFKRDMLLENKDRKIIFDFISKNGAVNLEEIRDKIDLSPYLLILQLGILEKFGLIYSKVSFNSTYFISNNFPEEHVHNLLILRNMIFLRIFKFIKENPGVTKDLIIQEFKYSLNMINNCLLILKNAGIVDIIDYEYKKVYRINHKKIEPIIEFLHF
ncbi:MAG: hypothetical protein ACFFCM_14610 [Promethearchaeota archaeon]